MEPQQPQLFELEEQQSTIIVVPFEELDPATQAWIERMEEQWNNREHPNGNPCSCVTPTHGAGAGAGRTAGAVLTAANGRGAKLRPGAV